MDLTTFPATSDAGSAKTGPVTNNENIQKLFANLLDSGDPSTLVNGAMWLVSISATVYELRARIDGATVSLFRIIKTGNKFRFPGNPDFNLQQLVSARLQHIATVDLPAAGAGTEGQVGYHEDEQRPFYLTDAVRLYLDAYDLDDPPYDEIESDLNINGLAGDAASAFTTTRYGGFTLAATKKLNLIGQRRVPAGWTGDDVQCEIEYRLAAAETANDLTNLDGVFWSTAEGEAEGAGEAIAAVADDIGSGTTQYTLHRARLVLSAAAIAVGDLLSLELLRGTAGGAGEVADIIVTQAKFLVPVTRSAKVDE